MLWREGENRRIVVVLFLIAGYVALAKLGLQWATFRGAASPVFPASGWALAGLLLFGVRLWPIIVVGRLISFWLDEVDEPLWMQLAISFGTAATAGVGAYGIQRWGRIDLTLTRLSDILWLIGWGAVLSPILGSTIGAMALVWAYDGPLETIFDLWFTWWVSNLTGILLVTPLILSWSAGESSPYSSGYWVHFGFCLSVATILSALIFGIENPVFFRAWLLFPVLSWAALGFGVRGGSIVLVPVAIVALAGTTLGGGPFSTELLVSYRLLLLQQFLASASITTLILAVVADERRGKEALRESEARYRSLFTTIDEGFCVIEVLVNDEGKVRDYRFLEVNPAFEAHVGFAPELRRWQGNEGVSNFWIEILGSVNGEAVRFDREAPALGRWFEGNAFRIGQPGRYRIAILLKDITERKRAEQELRVSEERLALALRTAGAGAWEFDVSNGTTVWGQGMAELLGFSRNDVEKQPGRWLHFVHPEDRARLCQEVNEAARRETWSGSDFRAVREDGTLKWLSIKGVYLKFAGGSSKLVGVAQDITAAKNAERAREELLEAERTARVEAERAGRMKDEFLATLSHELRTPLNAILGWSQLLSRDRPRSPEMVKEGMDAITRNVRCQSQLIDDLLDMSGIISGKVRLNTEEVELETVVDHAIEAVRHAAEAKQIALVKMVDSEATTVGDPGRLRQVLWNLLCNAIKFTTKGGRVEVVLNRDSIESNTIELSVRDTGKGIDPQFLPHVFDRFRQADASITRQHGGLGLGLSIVKHLVELHGGTVTAHSDGIGKGATFIVTLPALKTTREGPRTESEAVRRASVVEGASLEGTRLLVLDDEPDARHFLDRFLREYGADVTTASSAVEALHLLVSGKYDVIVSDIGMPGQDGYEFIRQVRELKVSAATPAVALTAMARVEDQEHALEVGYQKHIAKPVETEKLLEVLRELTGRF